MRDDRSHPRTVCPRRLALPALARISHRMLRRPLRQCDALDADGEPRVVHHGEHAGETFVLLADQPADGATLVAENHGAGRRAVHAELVLDSGAAHVIARAGLALRIEQTLRYEEQ